MLKDFWKFAMRGNVVDMAVGIIPGAGFGSIVNSQVSDVVLPPIGLLLGGVDFSKKARRCPYCISQLEGAAAAP
jgi:large conductance mechanosensitive channel